MNAFKENKNEIFLNVLPFIGILIVRKELFTMPDWSYHPLRQLLIKRMSLKSGRTFLLTSMNTVARIPGGTHLIQFLGHMEMKDAAYSAPLFKAQLSSRVGLSGKIDPQLEGTKALQKLGFGFLEIGPVTLHNGSAQLTPTLIQNQIAFPKGGEKLELKRVIQTLSTTPLTKPILIHIDETIEHPAVLSTIIHSLYPFTPYFVVRSQQYEHLPKIDGIHYLMRLQTTELDLINETYSAIVLEAPKQEIGGYLLTKDDANATLLQAIDVIRVAHPRLPIITSGGIREPQDGLELLQHGADLLLCEEEYVENGPGLPKRINELLGQNEKTNQWIFSFLFGASIFIAGIIATIFALTTVILPYDEAFMKVTRDELLLINPRILAFMEHDRMSLAGTMMSAGIIYMALSYFGIRRNLHWAKVAFHSAAIAGFIGILLFIGYGYFDWLHGLFWLVLLPIYWLSWKEGNTVTGAPTTTYGYNTRDWKRGVYGQTAFVVLGGLLLIGGIVISAIGISTIFVKTDIAFICMPPEALEQISRTLLPVIAHDRAGFGSALISAGILVLCTALWGYRAGEKWLWWLVAIGALPAFAAGIGTHFAIGYTTFFHLLPLYALVIIYLVGLVLSFDYLMHPKKSH